MTKPPGLVQRERIFYYRKRIPKDLVQKYGKREIVVSLDTDGYQVAVERCYRQAALLHAEFAAIRARLAIFTGKSSLVVTSPSPDIGEEEAIAMARELVAQRLAGYDAATARETRPPLNSEIEDLQIELSGDIGRLLDPESEEADHEVQIAMRHALKQHGYSAQGKLDKRLQYLMRRALVSAARIEIARLSGDFTDNPHDALFDQLGIGGQSNFPSARRHYETVGSAMEKFWDQSLSVTPKAKKTVDKYRAYSDVVVRFFGPNTPIENITRDQCHQFRDLVARLPPNYTKQKDAPPQDAPLQDVVAYADKKGLPRIAFATQELYLARMITFLSWARREKLTHDLDVSDIRPRGKPPNKESLRSSFTADQLTAIFTAPIFSGCKDDERGFRTAGSHIIKRSRYWLPIIGLCTGMRESEILRLRASNVKTSAEGTVFFDLTKVVGKNKYSQREVPIHSMLLNSGFLAFVEERRQGIDDALFPDVPTGADGTQVSVFSKRFATFLKGCGIKDINTETCFHMFRHTLKDALDRGNVPENITEAIQGWSRSRKASRSYGDGKEAGTLKPWLEAAVFPKFDRCYLDGL